MTFFTQSTIARWENGSRLPDAVTMTRLSRCLGVDTNTLLSVANTGNFFPRDAWISFGENAALLLYFNLGVLVYLARMGGFIRKGACAGKKYTRILIPSFVFILFADIFFIIISLFEGGLFRGWLSKKAPTEAGRS